MNDRDAAEAAGLNPSTAAYTKSKPRVRAYMLEHRAAVNEKLADDEAEHQRDLHRSRDQILDRLWQLANLSPEQTRGSIAGQMKAMSMIVAIEGLMPDRRLSPLRRQPQAVTAAKEQTVAPTPPGDVPLPHLGQVNPFVYPQGMNRSPIVTGAVYDANLNPVDPFRLTIPPLKAVANSR